MGRGWRVAAILAATLAGLPAPAETRPQARPSTLSIPAPEDRIVPVAAAPPQAGPEPGPAPTAGPVTGLPLPRYVSLKRGQGNARRGPSLDRRIDWVFVRVGMPLLVTAEHENWRRVEDRDGVGGWVHYTLLSGSRTAIVAQDMLPLRGRADDRAPEVARLQSNVIASVESCTPDWCEISAGGFAGWAPKAALWGVGAEEVVD